MHNAVKDVLFFTSIPAHMQKNYLIVGGSTGIGHAIVERLVQQGHRVFVLSRTKGQLEESELVTHIPADVLQDDLPTGLLPDTLHGLAYCPGSIVLKPFRSLKPAQFLEDFEINLLGAVKVIQAVLKKLQQAEQSGIVLFSTVAVGKGMPFHASIAAAKGAVEGLTRSLAAELAPGIRVNCIAPSPTDTPLAGKLLSSAEKKEAAGARFPLKRVGEPGDVAALAVYLLGADSSWMSGQVIGLDGGQSTLGS